MRRALKILRNLTIAVVLLAACGAALEFVIFRYILVPDDLLRNATINQVVRYQPNTRAVLRHPDRSQSAVTINAQGWNSRLPFYETDKVTGRLRIAVVGDAYVHGQQVNVEQGFPAVIARQLQTKGYDAEVYRFGVEDAPLSQSLHMLRQEVLTYRPDVVVVSIAHDGFAQSYRSSKTQTSPIFMTLRHGAGGKMQEVSPREYVETWWDQALTSATIRYVYGETDLYRRAQRLFGQYLKNAPQKTDEAYARPVANGASVWDRWISRAVARYVFRDMKALSERHGFRLVIAMDAVREAVYAGASPDAYAAGELNTMTAEFAAELELPFVDMQEVFRRDFAVNGERLEFAHDWHWNVRGNELAGRAVARLIEDQINQGVVGETASIAPRAVAQ